MPQQLAPFRQGTRKRRQFLTSFVYTGTAAQQRPTPFTLPSTGLLSRLILVAHGGIDQSGAGGSLGVDGLAGLYSQIVVSANLGSANLFQASGAGADIAARWHGPYSVVADTFDLTDTTASVFNYILPIDIAMNRKKQFALGLINLQDPEIQVQLAIQFNPLTSVATLATAGGGTSITVDVYMEYFEIPDLNKFAMPPLAIARTLEDQFPTSTLVGQNIYTVPRLGIMTDFSAIVYNNSIRTLNASVNEVDIRFNKTDYVEVRSGLLQSSLDAVDYGISPGVVPGRAGTPGINLNIQPGVFTWQGWNATDVPDNGDFRDAIDTLELTTTEVIVNIATGTTVVGSDIIRLVRRTLQVLN